MLSFSDFWADLATQQYDRPNARLKIYHADSDRLSPIFTDSACTYMCPNPIVADHNGVFCEIHLMDGSYLAALEDQRGKEIWRQDFFVSPAQRGLVPYDFSSLADLLDDETLHYQSGGTKKQVFPRDRLTVGGTDFSYRVAAAEAEDHHLSTAGGVKLYVVQDLLGRWNLQAFGTALSEATIQSILNMGGHLYFPKGNYPVTKAGLEALPNYGLMPVSNAVIEFAPGAVVQLEENVDVRHIFAGSSGIDHVTFLNPAIDGNGSACNGIGASSVSGWRIEGRIDLTNIRAAPQSHDQTYLGGGRGITFQYECSDIYIGVIHATNCFQVLDLVGSTVKPSSKMFCEGIIAENCDVIAGGVGNVQTGLDDQDVSVSNCTIGFVEFKNCGRSSQDNRINTSFIRQHGAGNDWPWQTAERPGTSFSGPDYHWQMVAYDPTDPQWDASATYVDGDRVQVTNDGSYNGLFCWTHTAGAQVKSVRGSNDPDYGQVGALHWGMGKNISFLNVEIDCDLAHIFRASANPYKSLTTRPYEIAALWNLKSFRNIGTTQVLVETDGPIMTNDAYALPQLFMGNVHIMETGNLSIVGPNLSQQPGASSRHDYRGYLEIYNLENGGRLAGLLGQVCHAELGMVSSLYASGWKHLHTGGVHISTQASNNQLRLERTGPAHGRVDFYVNGGYLRIRSASGTDRLSVNLNDGSLQIETPGAGVRLKQPDGTSRLIHLDDFGALQIE